MVSMPHLLIHTRRFPPREYHAITLFPFVFFNGEPLSDSELRHERVHLWQQLVLLVLPFYLLYLLFWLYGLLRFRNQMRAYRSIPFERSAYELESEITLSPRRCMFHWITKIKN